MRNFVAFSITFLFLVTFVSTLTLAQNATPTAEDQTLETVTAIEVVGNQTIGVPKILSKIKTRVGQKYLESVISDDLKRLYNTGYFTDVKVDREPHEDGYKVVFYVQEKYVVDEITFSKTKQIKEKSLRKAIKTKPGQFLDNKILQEDVEIVEGLYTKKGLTDAQIEAEKFLNDVTNKASVHFLIQEGQKIRIKEINTIGNYAFKDKKILKAMKTKSDSWFRSGALDEDVLIDDMKRIEALYEENGYIDATADFDIEYLYEGNIAVNIDIEEGDFYRVGKVVVTGNSVVTDEEIQEALENMEPGNPYSRKSLNDDIARIRTAYFDEGHIFAKIEDVTAIMPETGDVEIRLDIEEGTVAYVNKISVEGNERTKDIVVRRELRLFPGDQFDGKKLRRSRERLQNLGYFEEINFNIEDTDTYDQKDLVVEVKEAKTGSFSFGGGYSSVDRLIGFIEVEQRNFDISNWPTFTGGGQRLLFRAESGSNRSNFRLSFTEPWINDYPISGGFDLYRSDRDREDDIGYAYDEERTGGAIRFSKEFTEYVSAGVTYKFERVDISDLESGVSQALLNEEGENDVSVIGFSVTRDVRDSIINPREGWIVGAGFDIAGGFIGGDKDFYRVQANSSYYVPFKWDSVLEFRGRVGVVDDFGDSNAVPIFERFFAGGSRSIRGYEERGVGPLDPNVLDPIGGESMILGTIEYTIPVIDFMKLAVFYDIGNVWAEIEDLGSGGYKAGAGLGFRVKTPLGPINLDYGYPLNSEPGEDGRDGKFYFSVSRGF